MNTILIHKSKRPKNRFMGEAEKLKKKNLKNVGKLSRTAARRARHFFFFFF